MEDQKRRAGGVSQSMAGDKHTDLCKNREMFSADSDSGGRRDDKQAVRAKKKRKNRISNMSEWHFKTDLRGL